MQLSYSALFVTPTQALQGWLKKLKLFRIHDSLSKVTNLRQKCMPWDGTLDFWVLLTITAMNLFAVGYGALQLKVRKGMQASQQLSPCAALLW